MKRFTDLFWSRRGLWPAEQQEYVEQQFPRVVEESNLHWWAPGSPVAAEGKRILLGVATFSEYDMRLLDLLDCALSRPKAGRARADVFSIAACLGPADFDLFIPNLGPVYQTPVIGVWQEGQLTASGSGAQARDELLVRPFGLDWAAQQWRQGAGVG